MTVLTRSSATSELAPVVPKPRSTNTKRRSTPAIALTEYANLAAAYALLGKMDEAKPFVAETLRVNPSFTIKWFASTRRTCRSVPKACAKRGLRRNERAHCPIYRPCSTASVRSIARSQWNGGLGAHSGPSLGDACGPITAQSRCSQHSPRCRLTSTPDFPADLDLVPIPPFRTFLIGLLPTAARAASPSTRVTTPRSGGSSRRSGRASTRSCQKPPDRLPAHRVIEGPALERAPGFWRVRRLARDDGGELVQSSSICASSPNVENRIPNVLVSQARLAASSTVGFDPPLPKSSLQKTSMP